MNHAIYSLYNSDILGDSVNWRIGGDVSFDFNKKMKTSPPVESSKEEVGVSCSDKVMILSKNIPVISSVVSTERARVQAKAEFDLEMQKINLAEFKLKEGSENKIDKSLDLTSLITEFKFKECSRTKIDKSLDLTFLKMFLSLPFYISAHLEQRIFQQLLRRDGRS